MKKRPMQYRADDHRLSLLLKLIAVVALVSLQVQAQTFDARIVLLAQTASTLDVTIQLKSNVSTFGMGTSNLVVNYVGNIANPTLLSSANFTGATPGSVPYGVMTLTSPAAPQGFSLNILFNGNPSTTVASSYMDVAVVRFTITGGGTCTLSWRTTAPNRTNVFNDASAEITASTLGDYISGPLPIQLRSFTASLAGPRAVRLQWISLTEVNNYGFEVQKDPLLTGPFGTIAGGFVPGHGTTNSPHQYEFTDDHASGDGYYRLSQIDLDGTVVHSEAIRVGGVSGVIPPALPSRFSLDQNYPNPFNPATVIGYSLSEDGHVSLEVFSLLGQKMLTLVDEVQTAGAHSVRVDGGHLSSGMYIYRLTQGQRTSTRTMLLVK